MPEIVSPESKLYVKEEVEKAKKEIKEDIEKANSKAARTFTIVGVVLGILTGVGVYGLAANYVKTAIKDGLTETAIIQLESDAKNIVREVKEIEKELRKTSEWVKEENFVNLPVGTIIPSMLDPSSFAERVGDPPEFDSVKSKWVLADGGKVKDNKKDLNKSKYSTLTGKTLPPDLRGMFLRGMNVYGGQDPEQNRTAGDYQPDALQEHHHVTIELTGYKEGVKEPSPRNIGYTRDTRARNAPIIKDSVLNVKDAKTAVETRPKNVAVYFYIKIN